MVLHGPSFASCDDDTEVRAVLAYRLRRNLDPKNRTKNGKPCRTTLVIIPLPPPSPALGVLVLQKLKQGLSVGAIRLVQRLGPKRVRVNGRHFQVSRDVFNPKYYFTSIFMARYMEVGPEDAVLDMGTGSGVLAITAAQTARRVLAADVNPEAVRFARENVEAHQLADTVTVVESDLFSALSPEMTFDCILFNPPYLEGEPQTDFERALFDPNKELIRRFFGQARDYLTVRGNVQMCYSSVAEPQRMLRIADELGWAHTVIAEDRGLFESFEIYRFVPK